jgi:hypothetical protein
MSVLSLVGLVVSVIGGALGAFSIYVTWKLYQAGNEVNLKTLTMLSQVEQSSHTTEVTATRYTERLVAALIELVGRDVTASLVSGEESITKRIDARIRKELGGINQELAEKVRTQVLEDVKDTFQTLQLQTAAAAQQAEAVPPTPGSDPSAAVVPRLDHPGAPRVIRWIALNETKYKFFAIRFLREKVFATDPVARQGLQFCIDKGLLEVYDQPNPRNPEHSTKACRLNRANALTIDILR